MELCLSNVLQATIKEPQTRICNASELFMQISPDPMAAAAANSGVFGAAVTEASVRL